MQRNEFLSSKQCIRARMRARMQESIRPLPLSFLFFLQCRGPVLGFFFGCNFLVRFSNPGPGCFVFSPWGVVGQHEDKGKLQKRRALPEGRAKFCTLTRRREVQNGKAQYRNRVPQLSHPAGEHTCICTAKAFPLSKGGNLGVLKLLRGKVR